MQRDGNRAKKGVRVEEHTLATHPVAPSGCWLTAHRDLFQRGPLRERRRDALGHAVCEVEPQGRPFLQKRGESALLSRCHATRASRSEDATDHTRVSVSISPRALCRIAATSYARAATSSVLKHPMLRFLPPPVQISARQETAVRPLRAVSARRRTPRNGDVYVAPRRGATPSFRCSAGSDSDDSSCRSAAYRSAPRFS